MGVHLTVHDARLYLLLGLLVFFIVWPLRLKSMVGRVFDGRAASELELAGIRERLDAINTECPTHTFAATRAANIPLQGHTVSLNLWSCYRSYQNGCELDEVGVRGRRGR
jgi:hypothetical protein